MNTHSFLLQKNKTSLSSSILKDFGNEFNSLRAKCQKFFEWLPAAGLSLVTCFTAFGTGLYRGGEGMVRERKNPSSAAVSAASMKGNAGPDYKKENAGGKRTSQNQQYKKHNMGVPEEH